MRNGETQEEFVGTAHRLLTNHTRRQVLGRLSENGGAATVSELATWLGENSPDRTRQELVTGLIHSHLPMLADTGAVNYDSAAGVVILTPNGRLVDRVRRSVNGTVEADSVDRQ